MYCIFLNILFISPPSWETWWIYTICIIGGAVIVNYIIRKRMRDAAEDQRALREKVRDKTKELEKEIQRAEHSEKIKEQFLANMSHEIRTPMNAILGVTNLLLQKNPREDQLKYLNTIKQSSDNLLVIINDILDLSKIEAGRINFEEIHFKPADQLKNVYETLAINASEKELNFSYAIDKNIPEYLAGDPFRLTQILINLAGNAIKFTDSGFIKIQAQLIEKLQASAKVEFSVSDSGIGIAKDKLEYIFDIFTQETSSTTRKFGGTGLGLAICKKLIELQGGTIHVDSTVGKGSTFSFIITYKIPALKEIADTKIIEPKNNLSALKNIRILIAEDNEFNQLVAIDTLESIIDGVVIEVAKNGKEAVDKALSNTYDLILMDIQMPEMDGHEATKLIRANEHEKINSIPIIAMTASVIKAEVDKCFESGMNEFVGKPFSVDELIEKIIKVLKK